MKTPPFLLLATLLFWGEQTGHLLVGASVGLVLETIQYIPLRWDLAEEDFRRVWNLCTLLALAQLVCIFTMSEEGGGGSFRTSTATVNSAASLLRWMPVIMSLMVVAQNLSESGAVPLSATLLVFRNRALKSGRMFNVSYPYFIICLFSAGMHQNNDDHTYYWGFCFLVIWALWPVRSRRFGILIWLGAMVVAMGLGRIGAHGIGLLEMNMDSYGAQWMMKFLKSRTNPDESRTSIGQIGRLKLSGQIVIRLEPKSGLPPAYLREATYMRYGAQTWRTEAGTNDFQNISPDQSSENNFTLVPQETNTATVTISSYLTSYSKLLSTPEGLLPLPSGTHQLSQLPVVELSENKYGAVKAAGPGLMIFDAHFGPGKTMDTPPEASTNPFQVPTNEIPALDQVIEEIHAAGLSDNRKLLAVQQFFNSKFTYSTWQGPDKLIRTNNETPISRFLLYSRSGHCEYFATATVLLLRQLHIPARYAVGYAVHEARGNGYVVRERDAHAWCLVWDSTQKTWEDFDTTPGSWVEVEGERASSWERISDFFSWFKFELAKLRWGQTAWRQYALWALVPMIGFLLYKIIFRRGRQRAKVKNNGTDDSLNYWPGLDSEFYRLENRLAARGVPRQSGETLSDWLNRALTDPALADLRQPMNELLLLHYRYRFDPAGLDAAGRMKLRHRTSECLAALTPIEPKNKRDSMT